MHFRELPVGLADCEAGANSLIITSPFALIRPSLRHSGPYIGDRNSAHHYPIFNLANDRQGGRACHIICKEQPQAAHLLLDDLFTAYLAQCRHEQVCDAVVNYVNDGEHDHCEQYGHAGGYTMRFVVHCGVSEPERLADGLLDDLGESEPFLVVRLDFGSSGYSLCRIAVEALSGT